MKKNLLLIILCLGIFIQAQTSRWTDLFSYRNILSIREDGNRMIVATENGIFYYTPSTGEIKKVSKANGLHEVKISAFDYNSETQIGIVGYVSGAMDVITPEGIFYIVDIPIATGYNGNKKINHISINGDKAVISVGYGVSIFNVSKREFGDTAFFSTGGNYLTANAAVIKDNQVYVATASGIKSHEMNTTFSVFSTWSTIYNGDFKKIDYKNIMVAASSTQVFFGQPNSLTLLRNFSNIYDIKCLDNHFVIAADAHSLLADNNGSFLKELNIGEQVNTVYWYNNQLYSGTYSNGMYDEQKVSYIPDGPYSNTSYKISLLNGQIWISSGLRSEYDVSVEISRLGYYHYDGTQWHYPSYFLDNPWVAFNVLDVAPNPSDPSEIFFTNHTHTSSKGIYKMTNNEFSKVYTEPGGDWINRPIGCTFDDRSNLFCSVGFANGNIGTGFYYYDRASDKFVLRELNVSNGAQKPFTQDGVLYIPIPRVGGMVMYDYNYTPGVTSDDKVLTLTTNNNIPKGGVFSGNIDKNNDLWIGSEYGLRTLSNPKQAIGETNPQTSEIIIEENGLGEELFRDSAILQIAVDTGNQKWISIEGGGVFYISSNGDRTIHHFTKANSPLPNDTVTDIQIDKATGKVYFVTIDGVVVYQGDVGDVTENFGDVLVYPNPVVYSQYKGNVRIRGLAEKTNIRITDAAGNLVHSAVARGGYYEWNLLNQKGVRVASGIYYVLMTNEDGTDTATAKIAVVN